MLVLSGCGSSIKNDSKLEETRDSMAVMKSYDIVTLVSDSGITRYRVESPEWLVYDRRKRPCWVFPQGLRMEQFDRLMRVHSEVTSKYAIYYVNDDIWELTDSVRVKNVNDEYFETDKLIVEQRNDLIHTDQFVKVIQKERIITGIGMRSNQRLTRYVIEKTQGIIPLDEKDEEADASAQ